MKLIHLDKKTVPFGKARVIEFYKGCIQSAQNQELFLYSISAQPYNGHYRLTLSFEQGDIRVTSVFQIKQSDQQFHIQAENQPAKEIWDNLSHIKHTGTKQAIDMVVRQYL